MIFDPYKDLEKQLSSDKYKYLKVLTYRSYRLYGKDYFCDVCLVSDLNKKKEFIRLQKRWFGLSKKMQEAGEHKSRWIIIKSFNFPQKFEFERVRKTFNDLSNGDIEAAAVSARESGVEFAIEEIKKLKERIKKIRNNKKQIKSSSDTKDLKEKMDAINKENQELRRATLKSQVPEYKKTLKMAIKNLDKKDENYFQKLFEGNAWIFGPNYEEVIPKRKADTENQPDFILKRYDGFCDIVEIERPNKQLFTSPNKSKKSQPSAQLVQAISQAMDYIDSYNQKFKEEYYKDAQNKVEIPLHPYHPRGFVIIGQDKKVDRKKLRQLNNFLHNIIVLTYDEFLKQSEKLLKLIEN